MRYLLLFLLFTSGLLGAQTAASPEALLPFDPSVRTGVLPNGLKYFIKQNKRPEKRAELRLAVNAGSMMENEDQQGLAHFVEHMCFNGTKSFKKSALVDYLESVGTKFGPHLNAYTSFDETVYMLQLPTDSAVVFEKGFQILEEWAQHVTFEGEEIDKERGVVVSERRGRLGSGQRMFNQTFPVVMNGSRYAERLPIGQLNVLENAPYDKLRQFYRDWYRPNLMAVMAVGDFDIDRVEAVIKARFGGLTNPENPRERQAFAVEDHADMKVAIANDKEARFNSVSFAFKHPASQTKTMGDFRKSVMTTLVNIIINQRLDEIRQQPEAPFSMGFASFGNMVRAKGNFGMTMFVPEKNIEKGLDVVFTELERVRRFGFNASELERAKKVLLKNYETMYAEREKMESAGIVNGLVSHFLSDAALPGVVWMYENGGKLIPAIQLAEVNALAQSWIRPNGENSAVTIQAIDKEGVIVPGETIVRDLYAAASKKDLTPLTEQKVDKPLLAQKPAAGAIKKERSMPEIGVTELVFANGAKVLLKPTDFKNDEILFSASSKGGSARYPVADDQVAAFAPSIVGSSGLGEFNDVQLRQFMAGKRAGAFWYISETGEGGSGSCSPTDLETLLQMTYLNFTSARRDTNAFKTFVKQQRSFFENKKVSPESVYDDTLSWTMAQYHPRRKPLEATDFDKLNLDRGLQIYRERFNSTGDFVFAFVGNFKIDEIKPLLATYIGSLPKVKAEKPVDPGVRRPKGRVEKGVRQGVESKAQVDIILHGPAKYNRQNRIEMAALSSLLNIKLREAIREEKGGSYGVRVSAYLEKVPEPGYYVNIDFGCDPGRVEELTKAAMDVLEQIKANGADEKDIQKIRETRRREYETQWKENRFWLSNLLNTYGDKEDLAIFSNQENLYRFTAALTSADYQRLARQYFNSKNVAVFTLKPAPATP